MRTTIMKFSGALSHLRRRGARLVAASLLCATASLSARASNGVFQASENVAADQGVSNLERANSVLEGRMASSSARTAEYSDINFKDANESGRMYFPGALPFPVSEPHDNHNFAMHITGDVEIPEAGNWTFGVKSNGGFHLQIGDESMQRNASHGGATRIVPFSFDQAGTYSVDLTYYERAPRATLELFASEGRFHRFGAKGADWHLVGDSADGGLALIADPNSPVSADNDPSTPTDGNSLTPNNSVPEPGGLMVCAVVMPWLLGRRWRLPRTSNSLDRSIRFTQTANYMGGIAMQFKLRHIISLCENGVALSQSALQHCRLPRRAVAGVAAGISLLLLSASAHANTVFASFQNADVTFDNTGTAATTGLFSAGTPLQVTFEFDEDVKGDGLSYTADEPIKATVTLSSEVNGAVSGTKILDQALQDGTLEFKNSAGDNLLTVSGFTGDITGFAGGSTANLDTDTTLPSFPDVGTYSSDFLTFAPANDVVNSTSLTLNLSGTVGESSDHYLAAFSANADGSLSGNAVSSVPEPSGPCLLCVAAIALLLHRRRPKLRLVPVRVQK